MIEKHGVNGIVKRDDSNNVSIGSTVEVRLGSEIRYGVIRWIGIPPGTTPGKTIAAVELVCFFRSISLYKIKSGIMDQADKMTEYSKKLEL